MISTCMYASFIQVYIYNLIIINSIIINLSNTTNVSVNESFEKVASYGLLPNMIFYLMDGYHFEAANGASMLSIWSSISNFLAIVGAFLADSYMGRFWVILLGSFSSLLVSILLLFTFLIFLIGYYYCSCKFGVTHRARLLYGRQL